MPHVDLLELPYFQGISIDAVVSLVDLMEPRQFAAGELIVREGEETPQPLYIATSGQIVITKRTANGQERKLAKLESPTLFGEIELFCQIPPVATARATTKLSTFTLSRETFDRLFEAQHPAVMQFTFNVARVACHRLAIADEMLAQMLDDEDLVNMRRNVFARMQQDRWSHVTGAFRRPDLDVASQVNKKG